MREGQTDGRNKVPSRVYVTKNDESVSDVRSRFKQIFALLFVK